MCLRSPIQNKPKKAPTGRHLDHQSPTAPLTRSPSRASLFVLFVSSWSTSPFAALPIIRTGHPSAICNPTAPPHAPHLLPRHTPLHFHRHRPLLRPGGELPLRRFCRIVLLPRRDRLARRHALYVSSTRNHGPIDHRCARWHLSLRSSRHRSASFAPSFFPSRPWLSRSGRRRHRHRHRHSLFRRWPPPPRTPQPQTSKPESKSLDLKSP